MITTSITKYFEHHALPIQEMYYSKAKSTSGTQPSRKGNDIHLHLMMTDALNNYSSNPLFNTLVISQYQVKIKVTQRKSLGIMPRHHSQVEFSEEKLRYP